MAYDFSKGHRALLLRRVMLTLKPEGRLVELLGEKWSRHAGVEA
jgi:hypothetical protein